MSFLSHKIPRIICLVKFIVCPAAGVIKRSAVVAMKSKYSSTTKLESLFWSEKIYDIKLDELEITKKEIADPNRLKSHQ